MSSFEKEIQSVMDAMVVPEPVFTINVAAQHNRITVKKQQSLSNTSESIIRDMVMQDTRLDWSPGEKKYYLRDVSYAESLRWKISTKLANVIYRHHSSKNPRLTSLYKWYNNGISSSMFERHPELQDVLFEVWKYSESKSLNDTAHKSNVLGILEVTKHKYEKKRAKNGK